MGEMKKSFVMNVTVPMAVSDQQIRDYLDGVHRVMTEAAHQWFKKNCHLFSGTDYPVVEIWSSGNTGAGLTTGDVLRILDETPNK